MKLIIVGAGGHASVVIDAARMAGVTEFAVIDEHTAAAQVGRAPIFRSVDQVEDATHFTIAIGDNFIRAAEYQRYLEMGLAPYSVIHPAATVSDEALVADGVFVGANAVINPGAVVRTNCIVNTAAIVEHDCSLGKHSFIGPGAALCGGCTVGEYALIGANAAMVPLTTVGDRTVVGAGASVTKNFGDDLLVVGVPAREVRSALA